MKVKQIFKSIDDVEIGEVFQYEGDIWVKSNSSQTSAGFQCVELGHGNLLYIDRNTKVTEVNATLQVFTP